MNVKAADLHTLLVSGCLLGQGEAFDGDRRRERYVSECLGRHYRLLALCPGGENGGLADLTGVVGAVLGSASPGCGPEGVAVAEAGGRCGHTHCGASSAALRLDAIRLPTEEAGNLREPGLRESFLTRTGVYARWTALCADGLDAAGLVEFHARHKFLLLAHDPVAYRRAGRLVASAGCRPLPALGGDYFALLMKGLGRVASCGQHTNVLQHLLGFLRGRIDDGVRRDLHSAILSYRGGELPLAVPRALLNACFGRCSDCYPGARHYLDPYPVELADALDG